MAAEDNKAVVQRYWEELWNTGDLASIEEIFAPDSASARIERTKRNVSLWRTAFPDLHFTIEDILAEGDKVVVRWTVRGTNRGNIEIESGETLPPTGQPISMAGMDLYRCRGGKIVEFTRSWDIAPARPSAGLGGGSKNVELKRSEDMRGLTMTDLLQDLGVVPPAG